MSHHASIKNPDPQLLSIAKNNLQFDPDAFARAQAQFIADYPSYGDGSAVRDLRAKEYNRLDELGHIYLDYTGGGLYANSQLDQHMEMLKRGVYGNPHSANPTSIASTNLDESARAFVLEFFNADPEEYCVIFTSNASGALRLVGEAYPFERDGQYLLTFDNHNSVNGIREYARQGGAPVTYAPVLPPDLRLDEEELVKYLDQAIPGGNNLFAFPAQSNFSGVQHSLEWIDIAHEKGWDVLVDCAAFAPTNRLDLSVFKPDYIPLSFYKIFGYPTGVGALIAKYSALKKLHRPWFAGGTITVASVQGSKHFLAEGSAAFEDGTIDYLNLPAIEFGLRHIQKVGIETIHNRVMALTHYLLDELTQLYHDNGNVLLRFYGPVDIDQRGGTISLNFFDSDDHAFDYQDVETLANSFNISIRTGCFCNPGAGELAMNITPQKAEMCFRDNDRMTFEQYAMAMISQGNTDTVGAVRLSVGIATNFYDVYQFVKFAKSFLNAKSSGIHFD